jgi:S1-C subfamily serine protease
MSTNSDPIIKRIFYLTAAIILILTLINIFSWIDRYMLITNVSPKSITPRGDLSQDEQTTIKIFEQTSPSVVYITTKQKVRDFWSRDVFSVPKGSGSGFIWDNFGHIVTNHHVIEGASEATIWLNDGRNFQAILVGTSVAHDLAVLNIKIDSNVPPPVIIGSSKELKVGQKVFAIGNPFGLDYTLTSGIVSALDRTLSLDDGVTIEHLIQTDAAINPGNSGGPLLDSAGRLIGINTAIYSPSGGYAGIGFAVPADTINRVIPTIIKHKKYIRPSIGVSVDENINNIITSKLAIEGVVILEIKPESSAQMAGLIPSAIDIYNNFILGDIIRAIDGEKIESVSKLLSKLDEYAIGDSVKVTILRENSEYEVDIVLHAEN